MYVSVVELLIVSIRKIVAVVAVRDGVNLGGILSPLYTVFRLGEIYP